MERKTSVKIQNYLSVMFFGFFGGVARAMLNGSLSFYGTFIGNLLGCFLLAFLTYFFIEYKDFYEWLTVGLGTGFVGAFTTFSSFNLDTWKSLLMGQATTAIWYFFGSIIFGLVCACVGAFVGQRVGQLLVKEG